VCQTKSQLRVVIKKGSLKYKYYNVEKKRPVGLFRKRRGDTN
jgi:hypothetical protein